ncbi:MAG: sulfurtransferase TusA family protein [Candidatus Hydrothermarchaeales archaeon]
MSHHTTADRTLDCVGLYCPEPVFRTREEIDRLDVGDVLEVIADDPASEEDIPRWAKRTGHELIDMQKEGDQIYFLVRKGEGRKFVEHK